MDDEISMYSETESDEAMNIYVEQLEEKVEHYKNKCNTVFMTNIKLYLETERLKKQNENLKELLLTKFPNYLYAVLDYL